MKILDELSQVVKDLEKLKTVDKEEAQKRKDKTAETEKIFPPK